jgi:hypothetical protein
MNPSIHHGWKYQPRFLRLELASAEPPIFSRHYRVPPGKQWFSFPRAIRATDFTSAAVLDFT